MFFGDVLSLIPLPQDKAQVLSMIASSTRKVGMI